MLGLLLVLLCAVFVVCEVSDCYARSPLRDAKGCFCFCQVDWWYINIFTSCLGQKNTIVHTKVHFEASCSHLTPLFVVCVDQLIAKNLVPNHQLFLRNNTSCIFVFNFKRGS